MTREKHQSDTAVIDKPDLKKPSMFAVILLNDDYTPMDFVVHILMKFFQKTEDEATMIMMAVHKHGQATCGVYTKEIAETKAEKVVHYAQVNNFPLQAKIEQV